MLQELADSLRVLEALLLVQLTSPALTCVQEQDACCPDPTV